MASKLCYSNLPDKLKAHAALAVEQFVQQNPDALTCLTQDQTEHFQVACALSDFVARSSLQAPDLVMALFQQDDFLLPEYPNYKQLLESLLADCDSEAALLRLLRIFRLQEMVRIAVRDMLFDVSLEQSLKNLSMLADHLILSALNWLTDFYHSQWGKPCDQQGNVQPLLVYGMGKLGGFELNFSSDIDLIFTYPVDGETQGARKSITNQQFFTRLAQKLINALHQVTADGFVYRVDMRLRPYGESGPLVLSFNAMENYYQSQGRDWERYAMLKARLIGDEATLKKYHSELEAMLKPFVFRRYVDYGVIESLRRMKNMIAQEVRRKHLVNNIKLGAGGIREIEFIVQVFQMIRGGRVVQLQQANLLSVLPVLVAQGELPQTSSEQLRTSYRFLRRVENLIQAFDDQQTQTLPDGEINQQRLLTILNNSDYLEDIATWPEFLIVINKKMNAVHQQFQALIGEENRQQQVAHHQWQSLWDSIRDNKWSTEACNEWLAQESPNWNAEQCTKSLQDFAHHLKKKVIGQRGQQVLDQLIPIVLGHFQQTNTDIEVLDAVLMIFEKILSRTAYLELLFENEGALLHLIRLCQASSWIAEHLAKYPILLDELIDPHLLSKTPDLSHYHTELQQAMLRIPEDDLEAQMLMLRQFKQVQQLRIAAADVSGMLPLMKVSDHLTALAESIISEVVHIAWQQVSLRYGVPSHLEGEDKGFAVIGYGKTGGIELGYGSDLDLVFLHNSTSQQQTNGEKAIPATQFYIKLAQRMMHIFNTRMINGDLYEIDLRLRPSGNSGLLVIHADTYLQYLLADAWTWEHQALVRARMVYGNKSFAQHFENIRQQVLLSQRDAKGLAEEVRQMRDKMHDNLDKSQAELCDIKQSRGGLVDIEFLAQFLVLKHGAQQPSIIKYSDNIRIFEQLALVKIIPQQEAKLLINSYQTLRHWGHKATLKQAAVLMNKADFAQVSESVLEVYYKYLND